MKKVFINLYTNKTMQKKLFLSIIAAAWLIACNITTVARAQKTSKTATVKCENKVENDSMDGFWDITPVFPGGDMALKTYLQQNIKYPALAMKNKEEGRVVVKFLVEKDGRLSHLKVVRSVSPLLDAEALRVIKAMPNWTPGRHEGKPVRVKYNIPIQFKLQ